MSTCGGFYGRSTNSSVLESVVGITPSRYGRPTNSLPELTDFSLRSSRTPDPTSTPSRRNDSLNKKIDNILQVITDQQEENREMREEIGILKECVLNSKDKELAPSKKKIPVELSVSLLLFMPVMLLTVICPCGLKGLDV